jgi:hypothetical protein
LPEVLFIPLGFPPHSVAIDFGCVSAFRKNRQFQEVLRENIVFFQSGKNLLGLNHFCPQQIGHTISHHSEMKK